MKLSKILGAFVLLFFFLLAVKYFNISYPVALTMTSKSTELSVVGEGKVEVVPDVAYVDVGITVNQAKTVEAAQTEINQKNDAILASMKDLGINKKNIKTSNYSIYPTYDYNSGRETTTGYSGNVTISITTKKIDQVSDVIASATAAGANQVQGTRFEVENPAKYREQARTAAIKNAREQAQKLASNLGIKLGKVVNVVEFTPNSPVAPMYALSEKSGMGGGGGPAVEPGTQTISSVVTLYFEKQ